MVKIHLGGPFRHTGDLCDILIGKFLCDTHHDHSPLFVREFCHRIPQFFPGPFLFQFSIPLSPIRCLVQVEQGFPFIPFKPGICSVNIDPVELGCECRFKAKSLKVMVQFEKHILRQVFCSHSITSKCIEKPNSIG